MPFPSALAAPVRALALAALVFAAAPARAAENVPVRAADHGDYGRIVFDWGAPVGHSVALTGRTLTVAFDRPMDGSFDSVRRWLKGYVTAARLEDGGRKAVFDLAGDFTTSDFESGNSLAVDLKRAPDNAPARRIAVRAGVHDDFSRIVFDWPGLVDYKAAEQGTSLKLSFDAPANLDLDAVRRDLPPFVTGIAESREGKGIAVTISGVDSARFRYFRSATKVVVDVLPPAGAHEHAMLPAEGPEPAAPNPPAPPEGTTNAPQPGPNDVKPDRTPAPTRRRVMVAGASSGPKEMAAPPIRLLPDELAAPPQPPPPPGVASQPAPKESQSLTATLAPAAAPAEGPAPIPLTPKPAAEKAAAKKAPPQEAAAEKPAPEKPATEAAAAKVSPRPAKQAAAPRVSAAKPLLPSAPATGTPVRVTAKAEKRALAVTFGWNEPVGAAVYRRGGALWAVFDRKAPLDLSALQSWHKELTVSAPDVAGATALRIAAGPAMSAAVRRHGTAVSIVLSRAPARLSTAISPAPASGGATSLRLPVADARAPLELIDPDVGDRLVVVPVMAAGEGVAAERRYALFRLLASVSGVVVEPKSDGIKVRTLPGAVEIADPNGLFLSYKDGAPPPGEPADQASAPAEPPPQATPAQARAQAQDQDAPRRLYDLVGWARGAAPFEETRTRLLRAVVAAPLAKRNVARLALARFYFARGRYVEALGVLGTIAAETPKVDQAPAFLALRGAAAFLSDDYEQAAADLGSPLLSTFTDVDLWRGALAAAQGRWPEAVHVFARVGDQIQDYPPALKVRFGLLAAETAINSHEFPAAETYLDFVEHSAPDAAGEARVEYLRGQLAATRRETDKAAALYQQAIESGDPATKVKARFAKAMLLYDAGKIPAKQAIATLEDLRFAWRGDSFEFDVLRRLGDLYLKTGQYENGLTTLKRAVTFFPDDPRAKDAAAAMNATFAKLYVDGAADSLPPLKALGIYEEFRELTPPGPAGDAVIRKLAERMVDVDLLDQAAALLEPLVATRLAGADKLAAGTRLAAIRLLDKKPEDALRALKESAVADIPPGIAAQRRRLEARALAEQEKPKDALAALNGDASRDADLLRADILWNEQNWAEAAKVLARLTDKAGRDGAALGDADARLIVKRAAALWLAGNTAALDDLRDRFGPAMAKTPSGNDFRVIAAAPMGAIDSVQAVAARLSEVDAYAAFAADLKSGPKPEQGKPEPAKPGDNAAKPESKANKEIAAAK